MTAEDSSGDHLGRGRRRDSLPPPTARTLPPLLPEVEVEEVEEEEDAAVVVSVATEGEGAAAGAAASRWNQATPMGRLGTIKNQEGRYLAPPPRKKGCRLAWKPPSIERGR